MEAEQLNLEVETVILRGSDENRSSTNNGQDVPGSCNRTISRLPTLLEEQELEQDSEQQLQEVSEMEEEHELERFPDLEVHLELLRNSWTLLPANSSRVWLLGTGNTS